MVFGMNTITVKNVSGKIAEARLKMVLDIDPCSLQNGVQYRLRHTWFNDEWNWEKLKSTSRVGGILYICWSQLLRVSSLKAIIFCHLYFFWSFTSEVKQIHHTSLNILFKYWSIFYQKATLFGKTVFLLPSNSCTHLKIYSFDLLGGCSYKQIFPHISIHIAQYKRYLLFLRLLYIVKMQNY